MSAQRIIVIGHAALDFVYRIAAFPARPLKMKARAHIASGGGMAANAAAAAARLGGDVALWSRIGDDRAGALIRADLEAVGVDTTHVRAVPGKHSATAAVIVDGAGERFIVSEDDHDMPMAADWLPLEDIDGAAVVVSDLSWIEGTRAAFARARERGVSTLVDLDLGSGRFLPEVVAWCDYVIASAPALDRFVAGTSRNERLLTLVAGGVRHAGVTRGADGYHWTDRTGAFHEQPAFSVETVDTTGAGDAFHGAFAWALAQGRSDAEAARYASAAAALKCRKLGARAGLPDAAQVNAFLAQAPAPSR